MNEDSVVELLAEAGYRKPVSRLCLEDVTEFITTLTTYYLFIKVKTRMGLFREELDQFGMGTYVSKYHNILRPLFVDEKVCFTASELLECS